MRETDIRTLLKDEYLQIQSTIEIFDGRMLQIKTWSVSFSLAALGGAFATDTAEVLLVASLSASMFWIIEGFWKTFQYAYYNRSEKLEKYFRGKLKDLEPMQIGSSWYIEWKKGGIRWLLRVMRWPHVYLPHGVVFVLGIALYVLSAVGWLVV